MSANQYLFMAVTETAAAAASSAKAAITSAGINAATTAASNGFLGIGSKHQQKRAIRAQQDMLKQQLDFYREQNKFNVEQQEQARRWAEDWYNKYESPYAMMQQNLDAGINPYAASGNGAAPAVPTAPTAVGGDAFTQAGVAMSDAILTKGSETNERIAQSIYSLMNIIPAIQQAQLNEANIRKVNAEAKEAGASAEDKLNYMEVMDWELQEEDLQAFDGYDINSKWYRQFQQHHGRKPRFRDLYYEAISQAPARDLNRRAGIGALEVQSPFVRALIKMRDSHQPYSTMYRSPYDEKGEYHEEYTYPDFSLDEDGAVYGSALEDYLAKMGEDLAFGRVNKWTDTERNILGKLIDSVRKNRIEFGLAPDSSNDIAQTILGIVFASNPDLFKKMSHILGDGLQGGFGNVSDLMSRLATHLASKAGK